MNGYNNKKTIGFPDGFPFTQILKKLTRIVFAEPPEETRYVGQIPVTCAVKNVSLL